jgi:hypothetical protein
LDRLLECAPKPGLTVDTHHPASQYWAFQWIESAIFLGLTALLIVDITGGSIASPERPLPT